MRFLCSKDSGNREYLSAAVLIGCNCLSSIKIKSRQALAKSVKFMSEHHIFHWDTWGRTDSRVRDLLLIRLLELLKTASIAQAISAATRQMVKWNITAAQISRPKFAAIELSRRKLNGFCCRTLRLNAR